jgi:4-nitrophenyl phosphatase
LPYLIDLDGTLYCGHQPLPGGTALLELLHRRGLPYRFVTNAPENHPEEVETCLRAMGLDILPGSVLTAATLAVRLLAALGREQRITRVRVLGDQYLRRLVAGEGFVLDDQAPDCVLVSFCSDITTGQIQDACCQIREGALFLATNPDPRIPGARGEVPHTGMLTEAITRCTGKKPLVAGKPSDRLRPFFTELFRCKPASIYVVGDRLDTDMALAQNCGFTGLLMLTGSTSPEKAAAASHSYHHAIRNLKELTDWIASQE